MSVVGHNIANANKASLALVLLLALGPSPERAAGGDDVTADAVKVHYNLENRRGSPFPSDAFTVDDPTQLTGRRVDLPLRDCEEHRSDCQDLAVINTLDGFSLSPRVLIPFSGEIDLGTVDSSTVFLFRLGSALRDGGGADPGSTRVGGNYWVWDPPTSTLHFKSDEFLDQHTRYALIVTAGVKDPSGRPVASPSFARFMRELKTEREHLAGYRRELLEALNAAEAAGISDIVAMSVFTTRSITSTLEKIRDDLLADPPAAPVFTLADGTRLAFLLSEITSVVLRLHTSTSTENPFSPPQTFNQAALNALLQVVPGAIARVAFGRYRAPEYRTAERSFPAGATRTWTPERQGTNEIYFSLFIPAGAPPANGWPTVIFGPGSEGNLLGAANHASINASKGLATISINNVGNGNGPLTTLTINRGPAPSVTFNWNGRAVDVDGDGLLGVNEGRSVRDPAIIGGRDGDQQVVADLMALVRAIEAGVDWNGDGTRDLDPSRIYYTGHSSGSFTGVNFLAIEPAARAGVLFSGGGSSLFKGLGLTADGRNALGAVLAARLPPLLNSPGIACLGALPLSPGTDCTGALPVTSTNPSLLYNENMPARGAPVLVNTVEGAMAIQEWLDNLDWVRQPGGPSAFAAHVRTRPLPGVPAKPVILAVGKGDYSVPNPSTWETVRAGDLADRVTFFRNDLAFALEPRMPKSSHRFSFPVDLGTTPSPLRAQVGRQAQTQAATFLASDGATTIDPDGAGPLFETPIPLPLPEGLHYIPP